MSVSSCLVPPQRNTNSGGSQRCNMAGKKTVQPVNSGQLTLHLIIVIIPAEAQRNPVVPVSSTQSNSIASNKSPSRKSKPSSAHNSSNSSSIVLDVPSPSPFPAIRPFRRYSRRTLVALSKSPLVAPPSGMPALKDWFGCVVFITGTPPASYLSAKRMGTSRFATKRKRPPCILRC